MTVGEAILLGIVQGLTEFLPISSTAHLVFVRQLLGHENTSDYFTTAIQLGTLVAVFWYFRRDILRLIQAVFGDLRQRRLASSAESRMAWLIVFGTLPVVIVGGTAKDWLKDTFYNLTAMAIVAIVFAVLMWLAELWSTKLRRLGKQQIGEQEITWREAFWIGGWQALALMPGASRSGTTITAGLFAGLHRASAARFSFLLSLPSVLAAGVKDLYDEYKLFRVSNGSDGLFASQEELLTLLIGVVVSAIVGYLSIVGLLHFLKRHSTMVFIVYRLALGGLLLTLLGLGLVQ
jgi:undecaprenyl-diphosphatase